MPLLIMACAFQLCIIHTVLLACAHVIRLARHSAHLHLLHSAACTPQSAWLHNTATAALLVQVQNVHLFAMMIEFCIPGCDRLQIFQTSSEIVCRGQMLAASMAYGL
jgi:hypothetical protein